MTCDNQTGTQESQIRGVPSSVLLAGDWIAVANKRPILWRIWKALVTHRNKWKRARAFNLVYQEIMTDAYKKTDDHFKCAEMVRMYANRHWWDIYNS
jgi:hypothetical protein